MPRPSTALASRSRRLQPLNVTASSEKAALLSCANSSPRYRPDMVAEELPTIAQTPLVIAMPKPRAEALSWLDDPIGWSELVALTRDPAG